MHWLQLYDFTSIQLRFDCESNAIRLQFDRATTIRRPKYTQVGVTATSEYYVTVTLMTFDIKQTNGSRIKDPSCNHCLKGLPESIMLIGCR